MMMMMMIPYFSTSRVLILARLSKRVLHPDFRFIRYFGGRNRIERLEAYLDHCVRPMTLRTYYEIIKRRFQTPYPELLALKSADMMTSVSISSYVHHGPQH